MAEPIKLPERPPLKITLSDDRVVKMTYGLEMDIRRMLPDPSTAMQLVMNDPFTQDYIIRRCLTNLNRMVVNPEELAEDVGDLVPDDTEALLIWAVEHVIYFFVKRAAALGEMGSKYQVPVPPTPSANGSPDSNTTTQSAGPSESTKET
jgi:hypothetical protein